jgi:GAF domain-containing protein
MLAEEDIAELAAAAALRNQPYELLRAVELIGRRTIRQALFTVMRFYDRTMEVERLYSSDAAAYPVGGRKQKRDTAWGRHVLLEHRVFVGEGAQAIRASFDDHDRILGLGLLSVINVPVVFDGQCRGTVNFLCSRAALSPADVSTTRLLSLLAAPALIRTG